MRLTVAEIRTIQHILTFEPDLTADGRPIPRRYSPVDQSAVRWFFKNTEKVLQEFGETVESKRKEIAGNGTPDSEIESILNKDQSLFELLTKTEHEIEVQERTSSVIAGVIKQSTFTADDSIAESVCIKFAVT